MPSRTTPPRGARVLRARAGGAWARVRATPRELACLLAVAAVLALAWAIAVVPFQGPDEITHVSYVQQLAETGEGPAFAGGKGSVSTEMGRALDAMQLRSAIGIPWSRPAQTEAEQRLWDRLQGEVTDAERRDGTGPSPLARNPQLYYGVQALPYLVFDRGSLFDRLMAMRLLNGALFVLTVLLTWLLASEVFGRARRLEVTVATGVVALWPMLGFMSGVVNPDTGLVTAYTAVAWLAVRLWRRGPSLGRVVALCLAGAACMLVHGRGSPAAAVVLAGLVVAFVVHRPAWPAMLRWSAAGGALAVAPLVLSRLVMPSAGGTSGGLYGGEVYLGGKFHIGQLLGQIWQFYFHRLSFMSERLGPDYGYRQVFVERWIAGIFGSLEITYPGWVYDAVQIGVALLVVLVWSLALFRVEQLRRAWPVLVIAAVFAITLLGLLHTASYRALTGSDDPLITGRYLLPLTPLAGLGLAWVVGTIPRRIGAYAAGGVLSLLLLLQLTALGMTVVRFHA